MRTVNKDLVTIYKKDSSEEAPHVVDVVAPEDLNGRTLPPERYAEAMTPRQVFLHELSKKKSRTLATENALAVVRKMTLQVSSAPDGSDVFHLPGVPAMRRPPCFETYTPYSLTTAMAHQARWLASPYAVLHYSLNVLNSMQHGEFDDKPFNTTPHYWLDLEAEMWTDEETFVVLGGDDFRDMVAAAAMEAPHVVLHHDEMVAMDGVVVFRQTLDTRDLWLAHAGENSVFTQLSTPVRGIAWRQTWTVRGPALIIETFLDRDPHDRIERGLYDSHGNFDRPVNTELVVGNHPAFVTVQSTYIAFGMPVLPKDSPGLRLSLALLRAVQAMLRSPQSVIETPSEEQQGPRRKKHDRRKGPAAADPRVRVVSLRDHEHGRYQLEATTGRRLRAHWVRGHWRNQWYSATQEHRLIWVDGFVRGDAALGTVSGRRVHTI